MKKVNFRETGGLYLAGASLFFGLGIGAMIPQNTAELRTLRAEEAVERRANELGDRLWAEAETYARTGKEGEWSSQNLYSRAGMAYLFSGDLPAATNAFERARSHQEPAIQENSHLRDNILDQLSVYSAQGNKQ